MKKIITLIAAIVVSIPSQSQYTQNIDSLSEKEIKQFLLKQENEDVKAYMKKYKDGKKAGGILMLSGVGVIALSSFVKLKEARSPQ